MLITIVIPSYNRAHLITKTLDSIKNQKFKDFEVLIIDDGSTDNTYDVVQPYLNDQFHYYKKENAERAAARNYGTERAKGEYICWFDSDDIMYSNHLVEAEKLINNHSEPSLLALPFEIKNTNDVVLNKYFYNNNINSQLYKGNPFACNPVFVKRAIALENPFNELRKLSGSEDYELWLRLAAAHPFVCGSKITSALIQHDERSVLTMTNSTKLIERFESFIKLIENNQAVKNWLGTKFSYLKMKNFLWLAVDLAVNKHKKEAKRYLKEAFKANLNCLFQKSFYATIKHLILKNN
jgi:glycosyltransferase involved in cell wall biosynthesis